MWYYPTFRLAIPHLKACYLRVTHPFATLLASEETFSFDLHVLGTPPAFVLSQNQTLHLNLEEVYSNSTNTFKILKPLKINIFTGPETILTIQFSKNKNRLTLRLFFHSSTKTYDLVIFFFFYEILGI